MLCPVAKKQSKPVPIKETRKVKAAATGQQESTQANIEHMRPCWQQLARVLKFTGSFYFHCDWHAGRQLHG